MMIQITSPDNHKQERCYIYEVIFSHFLGIDYNVFFSPEMASVIITSGDKANKIFIDDTFFSISDNYWCTKDSMPIFPLDNADFKQYAREFNISSVPVIYGCPVDIDNYFITTDDYMKLGIDIFGSAFFMLTRYEEYVLEEKDAHDRFPVELSVAYKAGFLERPVVNEYVELLWSLLKRIEPSLVRKARKYKVISTHDIDKPFGMMFDTPLQIVRHFAGDIIYRKSICSVLNRVQETFKRFFSSKQYIAEKSETFAFIGDESKKHNLKDVFFFMNSKISWYDGNYTVDEPHVLDVISKLVAQGHHIGLHPSFESYLDSGEIKKEVALMNYIFEKNQLPPLAGARQHYLKWKNPETWQYYEDAGILFDSSMTFAGHVGFRCGVCYPFPVFNLETRQQLNLVEHPLIVMDGTLYEYMGLSHDEAMLFIKKLANECKKYNGEFVILWHNTSLDDEDEREFYSKMLDEVCCE